MTQLFINEIKGKEFFIDVGANFGHYSLIAKNVGNDTMKVWAFEPEPRTYKIIENNIALPENNSDINLYQTALSNDEGKLEFFIDGLSSGGNSLTRENLRTYRDVITVEAIELDKFIESSKEKTPLGVIKIDTQGGEALVLNGARKTIERDHPTIFCEFWPNGIKNAGLDPRELIGFLRVNKYEIFAIHKKNQELVECKGDDYTTWPLYEEMDDYEIDLLIK